MSPERKTTAVTTIVLSIFAIAAVTTAATADGALYRLLAVAGALGAFALIGYSLRD